MESRKEGKKERVRDTERKGNRVTEMITEKYAAREIQGYIDWMSK